MTLGAPFSLSTDARLLVTMRSSSPINARTHARAYACVGAHVSRGAMRNRAYVRRQQPTGERERERDRMGPSSAWHRAARTLGSESIQRVHDAREVVVFIVLLVDDERYLIAIPHSHARVVARAPPVPDEFPVLPWDGFDTYACPAEVLLERRRIAQVQTITCAQLNKES